MAMACNSAFWTEPGIHSQAQIAGLATRGRRGHAKGGLIALQIWHGGRACHPLINNGATPVAPSAIPITNDEIHTPKGMKPYVTPRELRDDEIAGNRRRASLRRRATRKMRVSTPSRLMARMVICWTNFARRRQQTAGPLRRKRRKPRPPAISRFWRRSIGVYGADRVGLRISPLNSYNSMIDSDPIGLRHGSPRRLNEYRHRLSPRHARRLLRRTDGAM